MLQDQMERRARILSHVATIAFFGLPLGAASMLLTAGLTLEDLGAAHGVMPLPDRPDTGSVLICLAVETTRLALLLWLIWNVRLWRGACASGRVFAIWTARHLRRIGTALLALTGAHVVGHTVIVAALTWANPPGQRSLAIAFGSPELILLLAAGLVTLFGWVQSEAARFADENEAFI